MPLPAAIQRAGEMAAAAGRLFQLIDQEPAVVDPEPAVAPAVRAGSVSAPAPPASPIGLRVRDLRFRYSLQHPWIFDGLSFDVRPGRHVALVGPTGVGKSTLVSILLRFWDYPQGSIEVLEEGRDPLELRAVPGDRARSLFSVMPQTPHLFHATIRDNLLVACPGGTEPGDEALFSALQAAGLADFVRSLPDGLATTVGDLGRQISVGEARRMALARALLKDAPVYILDEPSEGIDERAAEALLISVAERVRAKTLIVISHQARDLSIAEDLVRLGD
jgi:ABC-type transport system involved in cytochrome bd biosynthesis fused ATPase/permease subunit